jgi:UDP-glucuronate 4-epimerase
MRIVVTGAAGFIGSHVCERLVARGHRVVGIDAFTRFYVRELKELNVAALRTAPAFRLEERNLLDAPGLVRAVAGADAICHLAGRPGVRGGAPVLFEAGNVRTTEAVMRAAALAGVGRVVLASSSSVYGPARGAVREDDRLRPLSLYAQSKRRAELVAARTARRHGVELVTLRYFTVYGPRQRPDMAFARFLRAALGGGEMPLLGDGRQRRDFTYVGDAAEATALAVELGRPRAVYNVAGGRPVALAEALALLAGELGSAPALARLPADPREPLTTAADLGRARAELGWTPRTGLEHGLRRQVEEAVAAAAVA